MTERIRKFVGFFFDELPFSETTEEARGKIEKALEETASNALPDELAEKYGSYEKLAALAGYSAENSKAWRSPEATRDGADVKRELRRQRWRVYLISALLAGLPSELLWTVFNAVSGKREFVFTLLYGIVLFSAALLLLRKYRRAERQHSGERYHTQSYAFLRAKSDQ